MKRARALAFVAVGAIVAGACSFDFDAFQFPAQGTTSSSASGGATGGHGGAGGSSMAAGAAAAGGLGGRGGQSAGGASSSGGVSSSGGATSSSGTGGCAPGQKACGAQCVATDDPAFGCGAASCDPCALANATATCSAGACAIGACATGFADCDGQVTNGCEVDVTNDPFDCGACGRTCSASHTASVACVGGVCASTCDLGWANCATPAAPAPDDGCELSVGQNDFNCGGCGNSCALQGNAAGGTPLVCDGSGRPKNHCGCSSSKRCRIGAANGSCDTGSGRCICGAVVCAEGEACVASAGQTACSCNGGTACATGQTCCNTPGGCIDLASNPSSCGACNHACPPGFSCQLGTCQCAGDSSCNAGTAGSATCGAGICVCNGQACAPGERCQPSGGCG